MFLIFYQQSRLDVILAFGEQQYCLDSFLTHYPRQRVHKLNKVKLRIYKYFWVQMMEQSVSA